MPWVEVDSWRFVLFLRVDCDACLLDPDLRVKGLLSNEFRLRPRKVGVTPDDWLREPERL